MIKSIKYTKFIKKIRSLGVIGFIYEYITTCFDKKNNILDL